MQIQHLCKYFSCILLFVPSLLFGQDQQHRQFEKILGEEESSAFNEFMGMFKEHLSVTYPQDQYRSAVGKYLRDIREADFVRPKVDRTVVDQLLEQSGLVESLGLSPDSTTLTDNFLILYYYHYQFRNNDNSSSRRIGFHADSVWLTELHHRDVGKHIRTYRLKHYNASRFQIALQQVAEQYPVIELYIEATKEGSISPSLMAGGLLKYNDLVGNYFFDRIIVKELFLPLLGKERPSPFRSDVKRFYLDSFYRPTDSVNAAKIRFFQYLNDSTVKVTDFNRWSQNRQSIWLTIDPQTWDVSWLHRKRNQFPVANNPDPVLDHIKEGLFKRYNSRGKEVSAGTLSEL